jgi:hypothetical protein
MNNRRNPDGTCTRFEERAVERYLNPTSARRSSGCSPRQRTPPGKPGHIGRDGIWAIRLLALTGMRRDEVRDLRWEYVDWRQKMLRLPDSKTGKRDMVVSDEVMALLGSSARRRATRGAASSCARRPATSSTASARPGGWSVSSPDIPDVRLHDLRHSVASDAINDGVPSRSSARCSATRTTARPSATRTSPTRRCARRSTGRARRSSASAMARLRRAQERVHARHADAVPATPCSSPSGSCRKQQERGPTGYDGLVRRIAPLRADGVVGAGLQPGRPGRVELRGSFGPTSMPEPASSSSSTPAPARAGPPAPAARRPTRRRRPPPRPRRAPGGRRRTSAPRVQRAVSARLISCS